MTDDFFTSKEESEETTKIKVGEKEYTQDEISNLVGLGETAREYETKWNRKVSEFYPDYTQKSQRLAELEKKEAERAAIADQQLKREKEEHEKDLVAREAEGKLSPEEQRSLAIKQAKELGLVTKDEFDRTVREEIERYRMGEKILDETKGAVAEAREKYGIETSVDDVIRHMSDPANPHNPVKAIKDMFEPQIDKWKEEQLSRVRPAGFTTQTGSTAGSKQPPPRKPISKDKLSEAIMDSLTRSRGV